MQVQTMEGLKVFSPLPLAYYAYGKYYHTARSWPKSSEAGRGKRGNICRRRNFYLKSPTKREKSMSLFKEWMAPQTEEEESDLVSLFSMDEMEEDKENEVFPDALPILPLKNTVLMPGLVTPITVGRDKSIKAVQKAYDTNRLIGVLAQKDMSIESPTGGDLFQIGTIARILKLLKMPDGSTTAILQGRKRFELGTLLQEDPYMMAEVKPLTYTQPKVKMQYKAMLRSIRESAKHIIELSPQIPTEATVMLKNISNDNFLLSFIASNLNISVDEKQAILEEHKLLDKATTILKYMEAELQLLELKDQIENKVRVDIEKQQRDYFLSQQLKTIQEELGQNPQEEELNELGRRASKKKWPKRAKEAFEKELTKMRRINPQIAEYSMGLNYLETLLDLPWDDISVDAIDLKKVEAVLEKDHYGLQKVKKRILEHLAVLKLKDDMKAPILCLVGPPGVGKTSLGASIAKALKRKYVRMSLGGLHDESEIRGHRRTYIGAMPGRIIQNIKKAKSGNPVFILDEIDKIGSDHRGDPSSALLEVLDPEQNKAFHDNYLEQEYDLSKVFFIATANYFYNIQPALRDRMEVINLSGYSLEEKMEIAKKHLIPDQKKEHGLKNYPLKIADKALMILIKNYTSESGVRSLNRVIGSVMRYVAKKVAMDETYPQTITPEHLHEILGPVNYEDEKYSVHKYPGVAVGLAWTAVGGDILFIETIKMKGTGLLQTTGNLGNVMKESATIAFAFLKANAEKLGLDVDELKATDFHIHVPEGATPKDGPSAGITLCTALASVLVGKPVKAYLAMTGEITLRGKVLPVGGIKEKILAARRSGMREVILCKENRKHVEEIEQEYLKGLHFYYVDDILEVLEIAGVMPTPPSASKNGNGKAVDKKIVSKTK
jgi:ATP-dependent Lon protease